MDKKSSPKFPSREYFDLMFKESRKNSDSESDNIRVNEDPNKGIIRFLLNERDKFVRNR